MKHDKLNIAIPYPYMRDELAEKLKHTIVSHAPNRKLTGALHEETGAGYIEKHGGLVYRKALNKEFTIKNVNKIVDEEVKNIVLKHISNFPSIKEAFADGVILFHKDGKTPIKLVRILQSITDEKKLKKTKFGVKDKSGKIFKYMSYGNCHHVEIIQNTKTGEVKGEFVTMMLASHRTKGINIPKQPIIRTDHGEDWEYMMTIHKNETISIEKKGGERLLYLVLSIDSQNKKCILRTNTASTKNKDEEIKFVINRKIFDKYKLRQHKINTIGHYIDD